LTLLGLAGLTGMAVTSFGAFTQSGLQQLLALAVSYSTLAAGVTAGTLPAGALTGGLTVFLNSAATTPGNQTTRTAALLFADAAAAFGVPLTDPSLVNGFQYELTITQTGAGTLTLVGGTGVTINGTATVPQNTTRRWVVNLLPTTATFTPVSVGTYS
jgi:hypothetical protein